MGKLSRRLRTLVASVSIGGLAVGSLLGVAIAPAAAAPAPVLAVPAGTVTADRLPTAQINGVVWSQAVVGNTVYAGGKFTRARPAGAAAGTNETVRNNLLAYDITTGNLVTSFAPDLNGQVLSVAASPDGTRIYVVGDFTTANGQARRRVAAYSTATGQLITNFNPVGVNSQARTVVATNTTAYVGGGFLGAGGTLRNNLAAFRASDGVLLPWNPDADYTVWALAISADGASVFAGGSFENVGGQPAYGLAKLDAGSGALNTSWQATSSVRSAGKDAGITSLRVQGGFLYGTAYHFGPGGNLEGTFKAPVGSGEVEWVTDCHGDNYSSYVMDDIVYTAGHAHYCGNMGGGFPQYPTWEYQHAQAWTNAVGGDILNDAHGYPNWRGVKPAPSMISWLPNMAIGSYTGQYQAGWSVAGNNDYLVYGGEFPRVNGVAQQGLVRFAKKPVAPGRQGPKFSTATGAPTLVPTSTTTLRVTMPSAADRDDYTLTYKAVRDGKFGAPRYTTTAESNWWTTPAIGFVDTGLTPGATYRYQVAVNDASGNIVYSGGTSVTMPTTFAAATAYANTVRQNGASMYWPLNQASGVSVLDRAGYTDGSAGTGVTWNTAGAIPGDTAATLGDNAVSRIHTVPTQMASDTFTAQAWVKTTTTRGGRILGFGDLRTGNSGHRDRHIYMDNAGHVIFGVRAQNNSARTLASGPTYNDGQWHMITATMDPQGMTLYVDGSRVGRRTDTTQGEAYLGHWRVGGDNLGRWPGQPATANFIGAVDEVAVYPTALAQDKVTAQFQASGRTTSVPTAPTDTYGAAVYADDPDLFWRLGESSGVTAADSGRSGNQGTYRNGVTLGATGVLSANKSARFNGVDGFVASNAQFSNPTEFSTEAWFQTTTTRGGKIIGFGNSPAGNSSSYDRHVYMQNDGALVFGVYTGKINVVTTPAKYNDGKWHHVVATQSSNGMKLYVDSLLVGTDPQTQAAAYAGHWKVGGDVTWGSASNYLDGVIDEAAVYSYELAASRVAAHYGAVVPTANLEPTASFTTTTSDLAVTADASGSGDSDGTIAGYSWNFGDGWATTGKIAQHSYAAAGTYTITLTVTDDDGATANQAKTVTVKAANVAPTARIATPTVSGLDVSLDGSSSTDSDGTVADYAWDFGDETTGSGAKTTHAYTEAGTYTVTLTVTDNAGLTNTATRSVTVTTPNQAPAAAFSSTTDNLSLSVDASTSSDADGTIAGYRWEFGDGTTGTGRITTHTYAAAKSYVVRLVVTDNVGATNTVERTITVSAANQSPTAAFTTDVVNLRMSVDATGSSDPDGTIEGYAWNYGDDTTGTGETTAHTYAVAGTYTVTLTVKDDKGSTTTLAKSVTVAEATNGSPVARFTSSSDDLVASLNGSTSTDPDGTIVSYSWSFGDDTSGSGVTTSHTYSSADTYTVTLTVTDDDGATDTVSQQVTVTSPSVLANDRFDRTVTNGWGSANTGGAWTTSSTSTNFNVLNGVGTMRMANGSGPSVYLNGVSATNVDLTMKLGYDEPGTGGGMYTSLVARRIGTSDYRVKVRATATATTVALIKTLNGAETALASQNLSGMVYKPGDVWNLRLQAEGMGTTALRAKIWSGATEPSSWNLAATDTAAALQNPGSVGIYTYLSSSATNAPVTARVSGFTARLIP